MTSRHVSIVIVLLICLLAAGGAAFSDAPSPDGEPLPIRRVLIPVERVPAELERLGVLVQMPRLDFEAKAQDAQKALEAAARQPRLMKATYAAEFAGQTLKGGSGQWTVQHPGPNPGILALPQFNLAVSRMKLGNVDAIVGELDGKNLGLWMEQAGTHAVFFDWSARGESSAAGVAFELRLPACPVTILELKLPADQTLALGKNVGMLTGPLETEQANQRLWRIQVTGRSRVDFVIRKGSEAAADRLVFTTLESKQELIPGSVLADFDLQVEAVQHAVTELMIDHDPALQPYEVTLRQAELRDWEALPGSGDNNASVRLRLREPKQGLFRVQMRCLATRSAKREWLCPGVRVRGALARGEALQVRIPPAQPVVRVDEGQFQLVGTTAGKDGGQTLDFVDRQPEAPMPRRPRILLEDPKSELVVRRETRWLIAPDGMTLVGEIAYEARRGQQFQIRVQLPAGDWRVDDVAWEPKETLRGWTRTGQILLIDLNRGLDRRTPGKLTLRLSAPVPRGGPGPRLVSLPELTALDAVQQTATYFMHGDSAFEGAVVQSSEPVVLSDAGNASQELPCWFRFNCRDKPLSGSLRLQGPRVQVNARILQTVRLAAPTATVETRLEVEPFVGQAKYIDVRLAVPLGRPWTLVSDPGSPAAQWHRLVGSETLGPLLLLGTRSGFERILSAASVPSGETWRLSWEAPLTKRAVFTLPGELEPAKDGVSWTDLRFSALPPQESKAQCWRLPLATVVEAESGQGEVVVTVDGQKLVAAVGPTSLRNAAGAAQAPRVFRWQTGERPALSLWTVASAPVESSPFFDEARLVTYVASGPKCLHHFQFRAWGWSKTELPVVLPPPAQRLLAARLDGRWLDRVTQGSVEAGIETRIPLPQDGRPHWIDVLFESEAAATWLFGVEIEPAMPRLPRPPLRSQQCWRLAPGLAPLYEERLASLDRGAGAPLAWLKRSWQAAEPLLDALVPGQADEALEQQRVLLGAETKVSRRLGRDSTLGEFLGRLLFDGLKEQTSVVLDCEALREAGLSPDSLPSLAAGPPTAKPFWEAFGLVYISQFSAPLLTTRQRWQDWRQGAEMPEGVREAVAQAAAHGQDSLGHLCRADVWMRREPARNLERGTVPETLSEWFAVHWSEWEPLAGRDADLALAVVDVSALRVLGLLGGGLLVVLSILVGRRWSSANRLRLCLMLLTLFALASFSLPVRLSELTFWPALALVGLLVCEYPRYLLARKAKRTAAATSVKPRHVAVSAGLVVLTFVSGSRLVSAQVAASDLFTVYFIDGGSNRSLALMRPELLTRLDALRERALQPVQGAVVVSAAYRGRWREAGSELEAQLDLYSFSEAAKLALPFGGIELKEGAFLDGVPVFPSALAANFVVPIRGKGWHRLTLTFNVRQQAAGEFQEIRCSLPRVLQSRLEWTAPAALANLQAVRAAGEAKASLQPDGKTQELRALLGRDGQLQVRWRQPSAAPASAIPEVREHYFWDLDPRGPNLTALLAYTPAGSNLSRLELALPEGSAVRGVEAFAAGQPLPLSKWQVLANGGPRRLAVALAAPAPGPFQVQVQMVPRGVLAEDHVSLQLPMPLQVKPGEGVLAYRLEGKDVTDKTKNLGVTGLEVESFAEVWQRSGPRLPTGPTRAYSFRRAAAGASLELSVRSVAPQARLELDWIVEPRSAQLQARADIASARNLTNVELRLPEKLRVLEVQGPNIHHWSAAEQTLRVWLEKPSSQASFALTATLPDAVQNSRFALPSLQAGAPQGAPDKIVVRPGPGWLLTPEKVTGLARQPGEELRYLSGEKLYQAVFALRPSAAPPEFQVHTTVEPRGKHLALTTTIVGSPQQGELPEFKVVAQSWPTSTPHLEVADSSVRVRHFQKGVEHTWSVQPSSGSARMIVLRIRGQIEAGAVLDLPHMEIAGGKVVEERLSWPLGSVTVAKSQGLREIKSTAPGTRHGLFAALTPRHPVSVWQAQGPDWTCTLTTAAPERQISGKVLFAQQQAELTAAERWIHQADWLLFAPEMRDLRIALPPDAVAVAARVNETWLAPHESERSTIEIPLPRHADLLHVRLIWHYPNTGAKQLFHPATPKVAGLEAAAMHGAVYVPPGLMLLDDPAWTAGEAAQLAALAQAATQACAYWSKKEPNEAAKSAVLAWHQQFLQAVTHLEYQMRLKPDEKIAITPAKLREEHAAAVQRGNALLPAVGAHVEPAWLVAAPDAGLPVYWTGSPPEIRLQETETAPSLWWSRETFVLVIVGVFLLSWIPYGLAWLVSLWPEQLLLLAAAGSLFWGMSVVGLVMGLVGLLGRSYSVISWLHRVLFRPTPPKAPSTLTRPPS